MSTLTNTLDNAYEVVTSRKISDLQDRVRQLMTTGMRPVGGIAVVHEEASGDEKPHMVFAQALARGQA